MRICDSQPTHMVKHGCEDWDDSAQSLWKNSVTFLCEYVGRIFALFSSTVEGFLRECLYVTGWCSAADNDAKAVKRTQTGEFNKQLVIERR